MASARICDGFTSAKESSPVSAASAQPRSGSGVVAKYSAISRSLPRRDGVNSSASSSATQRPQRHALFLIERAERQQRPVEIDGIGVTLSAQQRQHALALAERIDADDMTALREELHRMEQLADLLRIGWMAEYRQPEGRLGDEDIAALRLEGRAGRVGPALVVAGDDDAAPAILEHDLRAAEHMTGRREADRDIAEADRLAIAQRLQRAAGFLAKPALHDGERLGCGQDAAGRGPGALTITMR